MKLARDLLLLLLVVGSTEVNSQGSGGINAPAMRDRPTLVVISIDGFRWDHQARYETPSLDRIAERGVRAQALKPVFPTLTFPNHYSIATGLYPANHGVVGNRFLSRDRQRRYTMTDREAVGDGSWYGGYPFWVVAEMNGLVAASFFFVGTEADVQGIHPSHWRAYNVAIRGDTRVDQVLEWLAMTDAERPHVITLYFEDVDNASHRHGVGSEPMVAAVGDVDGYLGRLLDGIDALPVAESTYVVVVSDHGQTGYRNARPFILSDVIDLDGIHVEEHGTVAFLYLLAPDAQRVRTITETINDRWNHGQAVIPGGAPESWRIQADSRFADVIAQADPGYAVMADRGGAALSAGDHGWSPDAREMHGIFLAAGPRLPAGRRIGQLSVVDVYPLLLEVLELESPAPIDGNPEVLLPLLAPR